MWPKDGNVDDTRDVVAHETRGAVPPPWGIRRGSEQERRRRRAGGWSSGNIPGRWAARRWPPRAPSTEDVPLLDSCDQPVLSRDDLHEDNVLVEKLDGRAGR